VTHGGVAAGDACRILTYILRPTDLPVIRIIVHQIAIIVGLNGGD